MTDLPPRWDPMTVIPAVYLPADNDGRWADKLWLNVPGPVYTGVTETCWTGRLAAPRHVLYGGSYYCEFVYRQPKSPAEVACLVSAADEDAAGGYAFDGDARWTPEAVRAWWSDRGKVEQHVAELLLEWSREGVDALTADAAEGARDFLAYLASDLETDLRVYLFRLETGSYPAVDDELPSL